MKRNALIVGAVTSLIVFAITIIRSCNHRTDASEATPACIPKPISTNSEQNTALRSIRSADCVSSNDKVAETQSVRVISGGSSVLEIDHGLPRQLVDTPEMRHGVDYGLNGAITLRVVDSTGTPVRGATVKGAFWNQWEPKSKRRFEVDTDAHGIVALANKCSGDLNFSIFKDGYYDSVFRYWFFKNGYDCAKDGRWLPWNPTVVIVLKEKRDPVSMQRKDRLLLTFPRHQTVGFDVETGDLVEPFGTGKVSDLSLWFDSWQYAEPYCYSNCFVVTAENGTTIAAMRKDSFSDFKFAYAPPDSGWVSGLALGMVRTEDEILSNVALGKEEYWVIAVRRGEIKRFAVVSDFEFGGSERGTNFCGVLLSYYLNPNPDDTNLEIKGHFP